MFISAGGFGSRGYLKFHFDSIDGEWLPGCGDLVGGSNKADGAGRLTDADTHGELSGDPSLQQNAVLVVGAAPHSLTGVDILRHCMLGEAFRHNDRDLPAGELLLNGRGTVSRVIIRHNALDAAVVIHMGVGNDNGFYRTPAQILFDQLHSRLGAFHTH